MEKERQKYRSWTDEEDLIVRDVILEKVKNGETQLVAFEELSEKLDRSPSSIAFRWNSKLRKAYKDDFKKAKEFRKKSGSQGYEENKVAVLVNVKSNHTRTSKEKFQKQVTLSYDDVIAFIEERKKLDENYEELLEKYNSLQDEYQKLKENFQDVVEVVNKIK